MSSATTPRMGTRNGPGVDRQPRGCSRAPGAPAPPGPATTGSPSAIRPAVTSASRYSAPPSGGPQPAPAARWCRARGAAARPSPPPGPGGAAAGKAPVDGERVLVPRPRLGERRPRDEASRYPPLSFPAIDHCSSRIDLVPAGSGGADGGGGVEGVHGPNPTAHTSHDPHPPADVPSKGASGEGDGVHVASERDRLLHLLRRTTYGPTPALVAEATRLGRAAWLEQQLAPAALPDPAGDAVARAVPRPVPAAHPRSGAATTPAPSSPGTLMFSLGQAAIGRAIWSRRQLLEVMVDFWSNHFNVTCPSDDVWDCRHTLDADVLRPARARQVRRPAARPSPPTRRCSATSTTSRRRRPRRTRTSGASCSSCTRSASAPATPSADVLDSARILTGLSVDWTTGVFTYRSAVALDRRRAGPGLQPPQHRRRRPARRRRLPRPPRAPPRDRPPARAASSRPGSSATTRRPPWSTGSPRSTWTPTPRSRRCSASCSRRRSSWRRADAKVRRPFETVVATVRALGFRQAAPRRPPSSRASTGRWRARGTSRYALAAARRVPGRAERLGVERRGAGPVEHAPSGIAAGWWPKGFSVDARSARCCRAVRPATHGAARRRARAAAAAAPAAAAHVAGDLRVPRGERRATPLRRRQRRARLAAALRGRAGPRLPHPRAAMTTDQEDRRDDRTAAAAGRSLRLPRPRRRARAADRAARRRPRPAPSASSRPPSSETVDRPLRLRRRRRVHRRHPRRPLAARRLRRAERDRARRRPRLPAAAAHHRPPDGQPAAARPDLRPAPGARAAAAAVAGRARSAPCTPSGRRSRRGRTSRRWRSSSAPPRAPALRTGWLDRTRRPARPGRRLPGERPGGLDVARRSARRPERPSWRMDSIDDFELAVRGTTTSAPPWTPRARAPARRRPGGRRGRPPTGALQRRPRPPRALHGAAARARARRGLPHGQRSRHGAARRRPAGQGRRRPAGRLRRLRRLGHARRHGRRRRAGGCTTTSTSSPAPCSPSPPTSARRLDGVTLVTLSEFGRRVEENGSGGADHGHGNAVLLLGGGVDGGQGARPLARAWRTPPSSTATSPAPPTTGSPRRGAHGALRSRRAARRLPRPGARTLGVVRPRP